MIRPQPGWWRAKPYRMVQTNLREIDASLDLSRYMAMLKSFHTEVLLFNTGGIMANYPTRLPYHFRNPHMRGDFAGRVLGRAHRAGMRFLARFDFSKVNETVARRHPDWLYRGTGGTVNYNGQVHTCVNGLYQQEHSLAILDEVLSRYPVDGVFFNMIGYQTHDYSGVNHGICRCANCRRRFRERTGRALPPGGDHSSAAFEAYDGFRRETSRELYLRIREAVKRHGPHLAVATYTPEGVDIYRSESNSGIDRKWPEWDYSAADNVRGVAGSWPGLVPANTAVHFIDFPYRHSGVSPHLTRNRLAGDVAHGGWVDYYVIGTLEGQEDRLAFAPAREVFGFHAKHERWFTGTRPVADACLVRPAASWADGAGAEYRGIFRMLTESHVLFDVVEDGSLAQPGRLTGYAAVILPGARRLSDAALAALDAYAAAGGRVVATGRTATAREDGTGREGVALSCLGVRRIRKLRDRERGSYLRISRADKRQLNGFRDLDLVHLDVPFMECEPGPGARGLLGRIPPAMFGPPEKCYYTSETREPGIVWKGRCALLPWDIGAAYSKYAHPGFALLLKSVLGDLTGFRGRLETTASPLVEAALHEEIAGRWLWLGLVNHSGALGTAWHAPVPMRDIVFRLSTPAGVRSARSLRTGRALPLSRSGGRIAFSLPELADFDVVVLEREGNR